jgi:hypothetical protein
MSKILLAMGLMVTSASVSAQDNPVPAVTQTTPAPEKKFEAGFEGMIGLSYGNETLGINVGGPSLKYRIAKDFKIGVGAFPSLIIVDSKAYPRLAVSPIIEYKKWMAITPYYGFDTSNKAIWTFGLGYKFI